MRHSVCLKLIFIFLLIYPIPTSGGGLDYPLRVFVYGTVENDHITGECKKNSETKMHCDFLQAHVSRKGNAKDLDTIISRLKSEEGLKELNGFKEDPSFEKMCSGNLEIIRAVELGLKPQDVDKKKWEKNFKDAHPRHKSFLLKFSNSLKVFCDNPTTKNYESFLRLGHEKDMRTCTVWHNSYKQNFTRSSSSSDKWISNEGPKGECDVIDIAVLKKADTKSGSSFWVYETERIITNKEAKWLGGLALCQDRPEQKMFYDWKQPKKFLGCDYIEFE
jgi:hypothetical protein